MASVFPSFHPFGSQSEHENLWTELCWAFLIILALLQQRSQVPQLDIVRQFLIPMESFVLELPAKNLIPKATFFAYDSLFEAHMNFK